MDDGSMIDDEWCPRCDDGELSSDCQEEAYAGDWRDYGGYGDDD